MTSNKKTAIFIMSFLLVGICITLLFPKEVEKNSDALIRIGAGDDVSGVLMEEIVKGLNGKYEISETMEASGFQDC